MSKKSKLVVLILVSAGAMLVIASLAYFPQARALIHQHRLVARLQSEDASQRLNAAVELAKIGDVRALPVLVAALKLGESADDRSEDEVAALCKVGGPRAVRELESALVSPASDRGLIVDVLACIDDAAARDVLRKALQSTDLTLLQIAVLELSGSRNPQIVDLVIRAEKYAEHARRTAILASLTDPAGRALNPRLMGVLRIALDDQDAAVRFAAAGSLSWNYLNHAMTADALADAVKSSGADVRNAVAARLAFYQPAIPFNVGKKLRLEPGGSYARRPAEQERSQMASDAFLVAAEKRASALLAARQDAAGFWRTSRSNDAHFAHVSSEMNTYLTPMIVDMLAPVAAEAGLGRNLSMARKQIAGEIEESGLVRYYGRVATGQQAQCSISPDADDTALAWRLAPQPNPQLLHRTLATLRQYRAPNGLYRTWLAPLDGLQCIDRGKDPDPTDIGVQMHVMMFLEQASPIDAKALCGALGKAIADAHNWVYYQREPLVPVLRQTDLAKLGCLIQIPDTRLHVQEPGQGKWVVVGATFSRLRSGNTSETGEIADLLRKLAQGDFLAIRRSPPLIYQNDATGSRPAYYWSQEFGYALWLRLYFENLRIAHQSTAPEKR